MRKNPDPGKIILTFTVSQWYCMPDAMKRMADMAHAENMPVSWQLHLKTALEEKAQLDEFHAKYGDELVMLRSGEEKSEWQMSFPWSKLNVTGGPRPASGIPKRYEADGIEGIWGYCDFQIGSDGITHWGAPWGMFRLSDKTPFIPARKGESDVIGITWTIRDIHKTYNLGQPINFGVDPIEFIRSKTLDRGEDITFFSDLFDELLENTAWNERVYCCLHEEADGAFIFPGKTCSNEGASPEDSEAMYRMMGRWLAYAKSRGATVMTLPEAVADYKEISKGGVIESTLLTRDKFHGRIRHYVIPMPEGVSFNEMGTAGNYPDCVFHFDEDCMLVFKHPSLTPEAVLNYKAQYPVEFGRPYPKEQVLPVLLNWETKRNGDERIYRYRVTSWYSLPYGLVEWGNFRGWQVTDSNCSSVKIMDERAMLLRFDIDLEKKIGGEANDVMTKGLEFWVKLKHE